MHLQNFLQNFCRDICFFARYLFFAIQDSTAKTIWISRENPLLGASKKKSLEKSNLSFAEKYPFEFCSKVEFRTNSTFFGSLPTKRILLHRSCKCGLAVLFESKKTCHRISDGSESWFFGE